MLSDADIRAMALDQSPTATGWAVGVPGRKPEAFGLFRMDSWGEQIGRRLNTFGEWLFNTLSAHRITHLFFEEEINVEGWDKRKEVDHQQTMMIGIIEAMADNCSIDLAKISVDDMRERWIGTKRAPPNYPGKMSRDWLKDAAIRRCAMDGLDVNDHNVAEAIGHLDYGLSCLSKRHASSSDVIFHRLDQKIITQKFRGEFE